MYNETVQEFLDRNGINPEEISKVLDCQIMGWKDINPIIRDYGYFSEERKRRVSIADIYGYDYDWRGITSNIFQSLNDYFDRNGDGYHSRSCDDLKKSVEEMLASRSFEVEPVVLQNIDPENNIYIVSSNGLHRYTSLRVLYLAELYKHPENKENIKEKYVINAVVRDIDKIKTYCNFILSRFCNKSYLATEYDKNYRTTGNVVLCSPEGQQVLTDEQLLDFTKSLAINNMDLLSKYFYIEDFRNFVETYMTRKIG